MHLTITGNLGSGKSTICEILKQKYKFNIYCTGDVQRKIALELGLSTLELNELMRKESKYDELIDNETVRISKECKDKNIVFDSRMAFHFVQNAYHVFVVTDPTEAAKRVMLNPRGNEEIYKDEAEAKSKLLERSKVENIRFKEIYKVDNLDYKNYNLVIDASWSPPDILTDTIYETASSDKKGRTHHILISPKSLYPTEPVKSIDPARVEEYRALMRTKQAYGTIKILLFDNLHYIIDGHNRTAAALLNGETFIEAELVDDIDLAHYDKDLHFRNSDDLIKFLRTLGSSVLNDYEEMGNFQYLSYPGYYEK